MKTAELTGALLDLWVAKAEGMKVSGLPVVEIRGSRGWLAYSPSTDWAQGGPLIEKYHMYVEWDADGYWVAHTTTSRTMPGDIPLAAICRAVVNSIYGDEVPE